MRGMVLFALMAGFLNILSGAGSLLFTSNIRVQDALYMGQILVGIGFIYMAARPEKFLQSGKRAAGKPGD